MKRDAESLRVVIVDDEAPARALLREYCGAHDDVEIVGECENGFEAARTITEKAPDLVLLDVQMPKLDGFEVLELLDRPPIVVFVTAYDEFALRAFEVHAVDYVLKPVGRERLDTALERARVRRRAMTPPPSLRPAALAAAARPPGEHLARVIVKDGPSVHVIPVARIDWIEAQDDYAAIHAEGRTHLKSQTLQELAEGLEPARFVRIHRSYLLNVDRLARLEREAKDSHVAILKDGKVLPVSRAGYARLKELM
ncbi:MAG: response regulator [Acidobacteriia bacterium]|nr:response regulator [Terriglobia bacterium]